MKRLVLALLILGLAAPLLAADLKDLEYFQGNWQCSGTAFKSEMGPEHPTKASVRAGWALNNQWLSFTYAEVKMKDNPTPFSVSGFMGYDPESKRLVLLGADAMGGYSTESSPGWEGDRLAFEGASHMGTMTMNGRDAFMKTSNTEFIHTYEIQAGDQWTKLDQETCRRQKN